LPRDTTSGPFADEWKRVFADISKEVEEVDITPALSAAFSIKDSDELVSKTHVRVLEQWILLTYIKGVYSQCFQSMQRPYVRVLR
jgi:nucleosome binding factor SPN SPT16 subunit